MDDKAGRMNSRRSIKPTPPSLARLIIREIAQIILALVYSLVFPQRILEEWNRSQIKKLYTSRFAKVDFYKSGRSALAAFFQMALSGDKEKIVLLPDYICNVVYLAADHAGAKIITYKTDHYFYPDIAQIEELLITKQVNVVLFASIFGTQNNQPALLQHVRAVRPDVWVVFDESQNIRTDSTIQLDAKSVAVISFNDKTIPGVMGGALCFPIDSGVILRNYSPPVHQKSINELRIFEMLLKKVVRKIHLYLGLQKLHSNSMPVFEFSQGKFEPYNTEVEPISKLSLIYAFWGLRKLPDLEQQRKNNSIQIRNFFDGTDQLSIINTEYADTSPYIPAKMENPQGSKYIKYKGPYAVHSDKNVSLRPDLYCIHNYPDIQLACVVTKEA